MPRLRPPFACTSVFRQSVAKGLFFLGYRPKLVAITTKPRARIRGGSLLRVLMFATFDNEVILMQNWKIISRHV